MSETSTDDAAATTGRPEAPPSTPLAQLRESVLAAAGELGAQHGGDATRGGNGGGAGGGRRSGGAAITLERPRQAQFGDYSTNAALVLAPALGEPPRAVAERLGAALSERLGASLQRFEIAGPGFLNLFLADSWLREALADALAAGERYGAGAAREPQRILVEFVSANPTGPMHVGHARNAAYGDALARMLAFHGHHVEREFYVNDAGSQVRKLGESIAALARGEAVPDDGYRGEYVAELVARLEDSASRDAEELGRAAVGMVIAQLRESLARFRVEFDHWQYESVLHEGDPSPVEHALALLAQQGRTFTHEGALWLRTSEFGDDKDRVLVRSSGEHTYFASDIAYAEDKRERGFQMQIDVWGADHHGYVSRLKAAYAALGGDPEALQLLIMQLVHLVRSGERAQMSKRAGEFVTLDDLVGEIGTDAARWYLLARSHDTTVDLDLDLAREQSKENDVYYVQYAHARIASMLARAGQARVAEAVHAAEDAGGREDAPPLHASERALIERLLAFPGELAEAAERRAPHRLSAYALELAQDFTAFYRDCRVIGAEPEALESFRIALCLATRRTIAVSLGLLGVGAPNEM
jgi:arginyl-tRNA synthetase